MDKQNQDKLNLSAAAKKPTDQIRRIGSTNQTCSIIFLSLAIWGGVNCINTSAAGAAPNLEDRQNNQSKINHHIGHSSTKSYRLNTPTIAALNLINLQPQLLANSIQTRQYRSASLPKLSLTPPLPSQSNLLQSNSEQTEALTHQLQTQPLSNLSTQTIAQQSQVSASALIDANNLQNLDKTEVKPSLNIGSDSNSNNIQSAQTRKNPNLRQNLPDLEVKTDSITEIEAESEPTKSSESTKGAAKSRILGVTPITIENYNPNLNRATNSFVEPQLPPLLSPEEYLPDSPSEFNGFIWPAEGVMTSGYGMRWGRMHKGIDIAGPVGTPIFAAAPGEIVYASWNSGGFGNLVKIKHSNGTITLYAHNSKIMVNKGQFVEQGEQIATMGSTGRSTGPHLHFEIRPEGTNPVNPMAFLPQK